MAILMTTMASSIGGKLVRGESLFDIMPIWLPADSATVLNPIVSIVMIIIGAGSLFAVLKLGPQTERIETDQS